MMIYRSLVVGLLGAIALLLAGQGVALERIADRPVVEPAEARPPVVPSSIVHISRRGVPGDDPAEALGLGGPLRVTAVDGRAVAGRWEDALVDVWAGAEPGEYFELSLASGPTQGRMLVLVTP